jgi:hypothetical protein
LAVSKASWKVEQMADDLAASWAAPWAVWKVARWADRSAGEKVDLRVELSGV